MDLYGDLPPAQGEATSYVVQDKEVLASKTDRNLDTIIPTTGVAAERKTKKINGPTVQNFAAFKPRQTNKCSNQSQRSSSTEVSHKSNFNRAVHHPTAFVSVTASMNGDQKNRSGCDIAPVEFAYAEPKELSTPSMRVGITSYEVSGLPYDPGRPNDYLEWCAERLDIKRAKRLEEENRVVLEAMEESRKKLEEERSIAVKSGDIKRLEASANGVGRGRGRGVTNLPAWMTNQHQVNIVHSRENSEITPQPNIRKRSLFTNPSSILLLCNIEKKYDSNLKKEMEMECQKYGSVRLCVVREGNGDPSTAAVNLVQVFIWFLKQESAVRAFRDLNGRYFDGRQIEASFYEENSFKDTIGMLTE